MYKADQADRLIFSNTPPSTWDDEEHQVARDKMVHNDQKRLARVQDLYQHDLIQQPEACYNAAMIFQHGGKPSCFLHAHKLALQAALGGMSQGAGLAAAALDRFLQSVDQPQVIGTQYYTAKPCNMGKFDESLSDDVRLTFGARTLAQSKALMAGVDSGLNWDDAVARAAEIPAAKSDQPLLKESRSLLKQGSVALGYAVAAAAQLHGEAGSGKVAEKAFQQLQARFADKG